jgi:membrane-bound lytic murein transglycosylase D
MPARLESQSQPVNFNEFVSTVELPAEMSLCGEKIPLEIPEVKERAERELYILLQQPGQVVLYIKRSARYFPMFERGYPRI